MGRPLAFGLACAAVLFWIITGPLFGFSDTWQLVINTGTTIITFLMVFLIQHTQNRDAEAIQVKLDELLRVNEGAHNALLDLEELDLEWILADAMRVVSGRAQDKGLTLRAEIAPDIRFMADRRAMKQIALNLLSNAVKFTPEGGHINVRGRISGGSVMFAIEDTGIGIPKQALVKLGRPFEQVESQLTKTHRGSGLGLAIARSLAELHGGAMRIRSTLGVGTIVLVRLPVDAAAVIGASEQVLSEALH